MTFTRPHHATRDALWTARYLVSLNHCLSSSSLSTGLDCKAAWLADRPTGERISTVATDDGIGVVQATISQVSVTGNALAPWSSISTPSICSSPFPPLSTTFLAEDRQADLLGFASLLALPSSPNNKRGKALETMRQKTLDYLGSKTKGRDDVHPTRDATSSETSNCSKMSDLGNFAILAVDSSQPDRVPVQTVSDESSSNVEQVKLPVIAQVSSTSAEQKNEMRLFALFAPGHKVGGNREPGRNSQLKSESCFRTLFMPTQDDIATSSTSARSSRARGDRDKRSCYTAPGLGVDPRNMPAWDQKRHNVQGESSSSKRFKSTPRDSHTRAKAPITASRAVADDEQPPSPLPPLRLNIRGTAQNDALVHSFFAKRPQSSKAPDILVSGPEPPATRNMASQRKRRSAQLPLWPGRDDVHVQPASSTSWVWYEEQLKKPLLFPPVAPRSTKSKSKASWVLFPTTTLPQGGVAERVRDHRSFRERGRTQSVGCQRSRVAPTVPPSLRNLPCFRRFDDPATYPAELSTMSLADRWRPREAGQILDNHESAYYLRQWLIQLQLTTRHASNQDADSSLPSIKPKGRHLKKRRVQTTVDRVAQRAAIKKARGGKKSHGFGSEEDRNEDQDISDFIIPDDDHFEDTASEGGSEGSFAAPDWISDGDMKGGPFSFGGASQLTNCIVLCGPSGSGKTAAVYACAEELHFEVFELFPGTGKRGGKELNQAVGDLARNHMVSGGGVGGGAGRSKASEGDAFSALMGTRQAHISKGADNALSSAVGATRQSLILLEEVDIVYEEDRAFWTGVVDLVARSRRPVVLTCNDLSHVPLAALPIQEVLRFRLPRTNVTVPYLEMIAAADGLGANDMTRRSASMFPPGGVDLRQALHQLQFEGSVTTSTRSVWDCRRSSSPVTPPFPADSTKEDSFLHTKSSSSQLALLRTLWRTLDARSMAVADLTRPFVRQSEADARPLLSDDDEPDPETGTADSIAAAVADRAARRAALIADEVVPPSHVRILWQQPASLSSPVVLPMQGKEHDLDEAVELAIRRVWQQSGVGAVTDIAQLLQIPKNFEAEERRQRSLLYQALATLYPLYADLCNRCGTEPGVPTHLNHLHLRLESSDEYVRVPDLLRGSGLSTEVGPAVRLMVRIDDFDEAAWHFKIERRKAAGDEEGHIVGRDVTSKRSTRNSNRFSLLADGAGRSDTFDRQRPLGAGDTGLAAARSSGAAFVSACLRIPREDHRAVETLMAS